ncbi:type II secretion system F family protein [Dactylosporangium sp. NBC_01737]|uniref:type II secretion system F family protein n=1 Tax=Dactylosporangium sp. NBC_01737 TaxID=2975959 RepID=UPI002E0E7BB5|nr:type II secretion system F family protein [Dactylosporangium sp. NBC_01737]
MLGVGLSARQRNSRQALLALAIGATVAVWVYTGWPVGGLTAGAAVLSTPLLFTVGAREREVIDALEGLETWTRRLKNLVHTGHGLISGIINSARTAPASIATQVADLAADLQAGADPRHALERFADSLNDFRADEVIASLMLHVSDRGQRLSDVLDSVATTAANEVAMRRDIAADRAEPRFVARFMTTLTFIVLVVLFLNSAYAQPYGMLVGQLVLAATMLVLAGLLAWVRLLTRPPRQGRFLAPAAQRSNSGGPDTSAASGRRERAAVR